MSSVIITATLAAYVDVEPKTSKARYELFALARSMEPATLEALMDPKASTVSLPLEFDPMFLSFMASGNLNLKEWASVSRLFDALGPKYRPCLLELREHGGAKRTIREGGLSAITFARNWFACEAEFQLRPGLNKL